jgi:hypothetical protein
MRLDSASVTPALARLSVRSTQKPFHRGGDARLAGSASHCVSQVGHLHVLYCGTVLCSPLMAGAKLLQLSHGRMDPLGMP